MYKKWQKPDFVARNIHVIVQFPMQPGKRPNGLRLSPLQLKHLSPLWERSGSDKPPRRLLMPTACCFDALWGESILASANFAVKTGRSEQTDLGRAIVWCHCNRISGVANATHRRAVQALPRLTRIFRARVNRASMRQSERAGRRLLNSASS